jgi:glycosyltransferase involved in cell wall biosynthesis
VRIGLVARSDNTGLGNQTRELAKMLNPEKILLIDSTSFNNNKQHPEWYSEYNSVVTTHGFPTNNHVENFLKGLDVVISCETFYNAAFLELASRSGVKTILQYNYEFLEFLQKQHRRLPTYLLAPSEWNLDNVVRLFGKKTNVIHLPPPTNKDLFNNAKQINLSKTHNRMLHVAGKAASKDRNGTATVLEMLKYSKAGYELVITSQTPIDYPYSDSRVTISHDNPEARESLYEGYDAMILPRRYAGLCLPMNEALLSGLPVFMTDISPNNKVLPAEWLAKSNKIDELMTRTMLDVYSADPEDLARIVDNYFNNKDKINIKSQAFNIGLKNFDTETLRPRYLDILG